MRLLKLTVFHDNKSSVNLEMEICKLSFLTRIMSKPPAGCHCAYAAQHAVSHLYKINIDLPNRHLVKMSSRASPDNPCNITHQTVKGMVFRPENISDTIKNTTWKMCLWWHFCKLQNDVKLLLVAHFVAFSKLKARSGFSVSILLHYAVRKINVRLVALSCLKIMHLNLILNLNNKANVRKKYIC